MSDSRKKQTVQIRPTNIGDGVFSFTSGTPQLEFDIPSIPAYVVGNSVRINGTLTVLMEDDSRPINDDGGIANNCFIDPRTGIQSVVDYVSISNQQGQVYEMIKNYNRLAASISAKNTSLNDYIEGGSNISYGSIGKKNQQGTMTQRDSTFSMKLHAGFLNGSSLIDLIIVKGMHIVIQLSPDSNVLFNDYWDLPASTATNMKYELSNVSMTYDMILPTAQQRVAMIDNKMAEWEYNSFSSYYSVLVSSDHNLSLNINVSRALGVTCNMIPSTFLNNYNYNSQMCLQTVGLDANAAPRLRVRVPINAITFMKGGVRAPLDFQVDSAISQEEQTADSERELQAYNSIARSWEVENSIKGLRTQLGLMRTPVLDGRYQTSVGGNDNVQSYHFGVSYDHITSNGVSFRGTNLGLRIQSDLITNTPHSIFLFVLHKNTIQIKDGFTTIVS